jgi:uncharacterized protein (PEP-CTERM system associated)
MLAAAIGCIATGAAHAEKWTTSASAGAIETYNHYAGEGQPGDGLTTQLTAAVAFDGEGSHLRLKGVLSATEYLYSGQGASNTFAPGAAVTAHLEAIDRFLFVDATANVTQTYLSPFGAQPGNAAIPTANRYTSESYSVSPYIQGVIYPNISYSLRDDNVWTRSQSFGDSAATVPGTYWNSLNGQISSGAGQWGWRLEYSGQYYDNGLATGTYTVQVGRAIVSYSVDPQLEVSGRAGYESDRFPSASTLGASTQGPIYGVGAHWRPTDRTDINGYWEHHYYGSSYSWQLTHRLPNVALSANFARGLSSYPQLALVIPAGVTVTQFLDAAFATRIPDPVQRAEAVALFLAQTGLPPTLASPLNVYASTITLQTTATLYGVWVGAVNSVGFSIFRVESEQVSGTGSALPPAFQFGSNYVETGAGVTYSHRLSALTNLVASATYTRTVPNSTDSTLSGVETKNLNTYLSLVKNFSPKTTGSVGVSYFLTQTPGISGRPSTLSVFASIYHTF